MRKPLTAFYHPSGQRVDIYQIGKRYQAETVSPAGKVVNDETFDTRRALDSYLAMIAVYGYAERRPG